MQPWIHPSGRRLGLALLGLLALAGPTARSQATDPQDETYELPPFLVKPLVNLGTAWQHGEIEGIEVLSQCSEKETREIVAALWRGRRLVLPPSMRPRFSLPMTVVLYNQPGSAGGNLATLGLRKNSGEIQPHWINLSKRVLEDRESFALNLWPDSFNYSAAFRFDLFTLFRRSAPGVPAWLAEGMFGAYGVYREGVYWHESSSTKGVHVAVWCAEEEARAAVQFVNEDRKKKNGVYDSGIWPRNGSPLETCLTEFPALFEQPAPAKDDPAYHRWAATLSLFVRWGNYDCPPERVAQFWRFAERACTEVMTEALFQECFGRSYADVRAELSWYFPLALMRKGEAPADDLEPMPKFRLDAATSLHIARVRGEWERIEATALAPRYPDLAKTYREQAARSLNQPKALGDARVQASLGLLALDTGDLAKAREHLEKAVAAQVPGVRPYFELARLRWQAAHLDEAGAPPLAELTGIIDLVLAAERQQPPQASVYLLLAAAVQRTGLPLTSSQAQALERGRRLFPRQAEVQAAIARLQAAKTLTVSNGP